jgi:tripartite-type tricarboxylate transporter receptor subunit TctC
MSTGRLFASVQVNAISDLAEGRLHVAVVPLASVNEIARSGKIQMLAVTNARHAPAAPDIATAAEAGYPQFAFGGLLGVFGPRDMPAELRERIAADMRGVPAEPAVIATLANTAWRRMAPPLSSLSPFSTSSAQNGPQLRRTMESSRCTRSSRKVPP